MRDLDRLKESQLTTWQHERRKLETDAADYQAQLAQTVRKQEDLKIKHPSMARFKTLPVSILEVRFCQPKPCRDIS